MKLAVLGLITATIGGIAGLDGLLYAGGWLAIGGGLFRLILSRTRRAGGSAGVRVWLERRGGLLSLTLMILALGFPPLTIGVLSIGFEPGEGAWRWLPIALGSLILAIGLPGAVLAGVGLVAGGKAVLKGVPANLTIESAQETGQFINHRPKLEFRVRVEVEGREPYRDTAYAVVPHTVLSRAQPGQRFAGRIDLDRPGAIEIDWSHPTTPAKSEETGRAEPAERLTKLEELRRGGLITDEEYEARRREVLDSI